MGGHKWVGINGKILGRFWHFQGFLKISITGGAGFNFCQEKMSYDNVVSIIYFFKDWKLIWGN